LKRSHLVILIILIVLILDQWSKIYVKSTFQYGGGFDIMGLSWAKIHFVENEGMAFGITFGGKAGKLFLSLFRIVMVGVLAWMIHKLIQAKESIGLLISFALIIAGALGNIIDSTIYGVIFSESKYHGEVAQLFPPEGGYAPALFGRVVDMFYFPMINTTLPDWVPLWGGERFQFFKPVFNVADAAISTGVISIILFHRRFFRNEIADKKKEEPVPVSVQSDIASASD